MADEQVVVEEVIAPVVETAEVVVEKPVTTEDTTLLGGDGTVKEEKISETPEDKLARETSEASAKAEEKRLLEADDKSLTPEELAKKQELVKGIEEAKANSVPEKYELVAPEGFTLTESSLETLTPVFKEIGLTNSQVQKLADAYAPIVKAQVENQQQEAIALWNKQADDWKAESVKMLGKNAKTDMVAAAKFMDRFGGNQVELEGGKKTNELRLLMEETRIGNNPVMLRAIIAAGKLLGEDKFVEGSQTSKGAEPTLYDHPTSKATLTYK